MTRMISALTVAGALILGQISMSNAADPLKIDFVYVGPIGDHGWTYQHDQEQLAVKNISATRSKQIMWKTCPREPTRNASSAISRPAATR